MDNELVLDRIAVLKMRKRKLIDQACSSSDEANKIQNEIDKLLREIKEPWDVVGYHRKLHAIDKIIKDYENRTFRSSIWKNLIK